VLGWPEEVLIPASWSIAEAVGRDERTKIKRQSMFHVNIDCFFDENLAFPYMC
jgi:hypothetical protein